MSTTPGMLTLFKDIDLFIEGPIKQKFQLYDGEYPGCYQARSSTLGKVIETRFVAYGPLYVKKPPEY